MRTAVIFAFAIVALFAATSAAPPRKLSPVSRLASLLTSKLHRSSHKTEAAVAVLPHAGTRSEIIDQTIIATARISKSVANFFYLSNKMEQDWSPSDKFEAARQWRDTSTSEFNEAWNGVLWDAVWSGELDREVIRARAEQAATELEVVITGAMDGLLREQNLITFAIKLNMLYDIVEMMLEVTNAVADVWEVIQGTPQPELRETIQTVHTTWTQMIRNPAQVQSFLEDLSAKTVDALTGTVHAFMVLFPETEEFLNEADADYIDFDHAMTVFSDGALDVLGIFYEFLDQSFLAATEAEANAAVAQAMNDYEVAWGKIIPRIELLNPNSQRLLTGWSSIFSRFLYRHTSSMEPLIQLLRNIF